jgi:hypothetical protein
MTASTSARVTALGRVGVGHHREPRLVRGALGGEQRVVLPGGEHRNLEAVGMARHHVERIAADRSRGAQYCEPFSPSLFSLSLGRGSG